MSDIKPRDELEPTESLVDGLVSGGCAETNSSSERRLLGCLGHRHRRHAGGRRQGDRRGPARGSPPRGQHRQPPRRRRGREQGVQDKIGDMKKQFGIDVKMTALPVGAAEREAERERQGADRHLRPDLGARLHRLAVRRRRLLHPLDALRARSSGRATAIRTTSRKGELDYLELLRHQARSRFGGNTPLPDPRPARRVDHLFYRKDLLKKAGIAVPTTSGQYLAAAKKLNGNGVAGNSMIAKSGDVSMFLVDWYTRFANIGREADERLAAGEELHAAADQPGRRRRAAAHGRLREFADKGVSSLRLHRLDRRVQRRQDGDDADVVDDRRARSTTRRRRRSPARSASPRRPRRQGPARARRLGHGHPEERARTRTPPGR